MGTDGDKVEEDPAMSGVASVTVDPGAIRRYAARAWDEAEAGKREHWARELATRGPEPAIRAARALWDHARARCPGWPSAEARDEDLRHHVALKDELDRASRAFRGRRAPR
jgi:hypothetical protein